MALIAIGGNSGSGKSTSIMNLDPKETFIIQIIPKPLPFKNWKINYPVLNKKTFEGNRYIVFENQWNVDNQNIKKQYMNAAIRIVNVLKKINNTRKEIKNIIIDDSQYQMGFEIMARGNEAGYDKFSSIAFNFFNIMEQATLMSEDFNIVFLHHTELFDGITQLKTSGKMFNNIITLEGLFTVVLMTKLEINNGKTEYKFLTHSDGYNTVKSPVGMFDEDLIPNDLLIVFKKIKEYE